MTQIIVHTDHL